MYERALEAASPEQKPWIALNAFGYTFMPILGGIVLIAAGMKLAVVHYAEPASLPTALFLAAGASLYLLGLVAFRWFVHSGRLTIRVLIAVVVLATSLVGIVLSSIAQLAVLVLVLIGGTMVDAALG